MTILASGSERAWSAAIARLETTTTSIEGVAIVSLSSTSCRFMAFQPDAGGMPVRGIELSAASLRHWGTSAPRPVGPQVLLATGRDSDRRGGEIVAGRLTSFDGRTMVVAGGDLGAVRLPTHLVDRWVSTASVGPRLLAAGPLGSTGPRVLLVNGDVVEPESVRIADDVAWLQPRKTTGVPDPQPVAFPSERVLAIAPAADALRPRDRPAIVVVLADGSRVAVTGLTVEPPPSADGVPTRRTATLFATWNTGDGETTAGQEASLSCDADAITAVEFLETSPDSVSGASPR